MAPGGAMREAWWLTLGIAISFLILRMVYVVLLCRGRKAMRARERKVRALVVLGSGGHTAEMAQLLSKLDPNAYAPPLLLRAATDTMSEAMVARKVHHLAPGGAWHNRARFAVTPRSREVGQSWLTTVGTTVVASLHAIWLVFRERPDVVLCNGPGTCVPIAGAVVLLNTLAIGRSKTRIVYIESVARVESLSLSGKILYPIADGEMQTTASARRGFVSPASSGNRQGT